MGKYRKVAFVEDFYSTSKEVHEKELLHAGYRKTYEKVVNLNFEPGIWCYNHSVDFFLIG